MIKVLLVDVNASMVKAWREVFEGNPEVDIVQGSMLHQDVDAWVTPTNGKGSMDGGLDAVIKKHLGPAIQTRVQQEIALRYKGTMPVGTATCVPSGKPSPRFLISTPTMSQSSQDISDTLNVALACSAAFQMVHMQNAAVPGSITSVALPGLGANTGKVPVEICADLMWTVYNLFREHTYTDFGAMRAALEEELGALGNELSPGTTVAAKPVTKTPSPSATGGYGKPASAVSTGAVPKAPPAPKVPDDFDDHG